MKSWSPKKVIMTSLALAVMLGGSMVYANEQRAMAESADQAAQQQAPQDQSRQEGSGKHERVHFDKSMPIIEEASSILGIDTAALRSALKDKTLVEIAKEKGVSEADLIAKLQSARSKKIDEAVKAGKLTAEKAEKIKARLDKHLKFMVNHKGSEFFWKHGRKHKALWPSSDKLASILGITEAELHAQLKAGKSLTEIAQAKGISKDQLVSKIKDELTPLIEKVADHKRGSSSDKPESKK